VFPKVNTNAKVSLRGLVLWEKRYAIPSLRDSFAHEPVTKDRENKREKREKGAHSIKREKKIRKA